MCFFVFIADAIVSPIPPDAMLFVIATSDLRENWIFYASLLGVSSVLGGNAGYWVGYLMREKSWLPQKFVILANKKKLMIEKFGHWVVVLGALTPLPFSISCWAAGMVRLKWSHFFWATLFRIPRIMGAYYMLHNSKNLTDFFTSWL